MQINALCALKFRIFLKFVAPYFVTSRTSADFNSIESKKRRTNHQSAQRERSYKEQKVDMLLRNSICRQRRLDMLHPVKLDMLLIQREKLKKWTCRQARPNFLVFAPNHFVHYSCIGLNDFYYLCRNLCHLPFRKGYSGVSPKRVKGEILIV